MESRIKELATTGKYKNVNQFALAAGLPWAMARDIWTGDLTYKSLKTLFLAAKALDCKVDDLFSVEAN